MNLIVECIPSFGKYYDLKAGKKLSALLTKLNVTHLLTRATRDLSITANVKSRLKDKIHTSYFMEMQLGVKKTGLSHTQRFKGIDHNVMEYLLSEVLLHQPQAVQDFLLRTSLLDRFCASLCESITDQSATECQDMLDTLERANLFIVSLDNEHKWYRYHHLFQGLLKQNLQSRLAISDVASLHGKASDWLASHGLDRGDDAAYHLPGELRCLGGRHFALRLPRGTQRHRDLERSLV